MARSRSSVPMNLLASFPKNESCDNAKSFVSVTRCLCLFSKTKFSLAFNTYMSHTTAKDKQIAGCMARRFFDN